MDLCNEYSSVSVFKEVLYDYIIQCENAGHQQNWFIGCDTDYLVRFYTILLCHYSSAWHVPALVQMQAESPTANSMLLVFTHNPSLH